MKKSFLCEGKMPFVTEMVHGPSAKKAECKIRNAIAEGATAIGLQLHTFGKEERTREMISGLFAAAGDHPVYVTNYRQGSNEGKSDEELAHELLELPEWGATLIDLPGDMFDPSPEEFTANAAAIEKQKRFIEEAHARGGEVLISSHINTFREADRVLEIALGQQKRGADIVKIVTGAETQEEELKNLEICRLLKSELRVPFLFLSGGKYCKLHRTIGVALGVCMWLCFREYDETAYPGPPLLKNVLKIKSALDL